MYIHIDYSSPIHKKDFPEEFGKIIRNFSDEKINKIENSYFLNGLALFGNETGKSQISEISKINFFVGANNSGKSRFLRGLFKVNSFFCTERSKSVLELFFELQDNDSVFYLEMQEHIFGKKLKKLSDLFNNLDQIENVQESVIYLKNNNIHHIHIQIIDKILNFLQELNFHSDNNLKSKIYIPVLRTLIVDEHLNTQSFNRIYEIKYGLKENVYTGLNFYDDVDKLHSSVDIIKLESFASWIQQNFYKNYKLQLIPDKRDSRNILLKIGDEIHPIFDIGDGIQQLILLMFPIFTSDNNAWIFIEEPETHLHPGLQRIFIETLLNDDYLKTKNLRYFFTTHSNHFLDLSLQNDDVSIFQFQKESQKKFNIKNVKPNKETLDLLGVNNSSVLMSNSSIWVEGPTDRKYISKFLKLFTQKEKNQNLKEDIDFAFFEYGGNLIAHYLFDPDFDEVFSENEVREKINSFALSNKIFLLADNDNAKGKKLKRREELEEISKAERNFKYQNTNYREIENLLPVKVIKDFLVELVNSSEKENVNQISFNREDYISIGIGDFITDLFNQNGITDFKKFKDVSGTLKASYKTKLCDFVVNGNYNYQELIENNEQLNSIIIDLYKFINQK